MTNVFPTVVNGAPVTADDWFNPVAEAVSDLSVNLTNRVAALEGRGFILDKKDVTSNVGTTTVEVVSGFIQWPGVTGFRYKITVSAPFQSTVLGDIVVLKVRNAANTADVTGTILRNQKPHAPSAGKAMPIELTGRFDCTSTGTQTTVLTLIRDAGTGTVSANANTANAEIYFMVENLGAY